VRTSFGFCSAITIAIAIAIAIAITITITITTTNHHHHHYHQIWHGFGRSRRFHPAEAKSFRHRHAAD
jgi:hypothetical protein